MAFLKAWASGDMPGMVKQTQITWRESGHPGNTPEEWLFREYQYRPISGWKITGVTMVGEASADYAVTVMDARQKTERNINIRVICEASAYEPTIRGTWGVNPASAVKGWTIV